MQQGLSIYLDLVRFSAAIAVFLGHASGVTGGLFWQFWSYSYTFAAVIIFFVLSGYVIGYVANTKESRIGDYVVARLSRFYSVILPAMLITLICGSISLSFDGPFVEDIKSLSYSEHALRYLLTLFNMQDIWSIDRTPGLNGPFWSMSYEFIYYCIFAGMFYLKGKMRAYVTAFFILLAGPTIIAMFPIWLMGYCTYRLHSRKYNELCDSKIAAMLSLLGLIMLLVVSPILKVNGYLDSNIPYISQPLFENYFDALSFTVHLLFVPSLLVYVKRILYFCERWIRWFASLTFALYLFHLPIITALPVLYYENESALSSRIILYGGTFMIVCTLGRWCESQKYSVKEFVKPITYRFFSRY